VDGAALVLIGNERAGRDLGLKPRARIVATALVGTEPTIMLEGPAPAARKALAKAGLRVEDIDLFELNEAFAAVVLRFQSLLGIPDERINVNGGAIAMGHPIGATGAMILGTLLDELERRNLKRGCARCARAAASALQPSSSACDPPLRADPLQRGAGTMGYITLDKGAQGIVELVFDQRAPAQHDGPRIRCRNEGGGSRVAGHGRRGRRHGRYVRSGKPGQFLRRAATSRKCSRMDLDVPVERKQEMFEGTLATKAPLRTLETLGVPVAVGINGAALGGGSRSRWPATIASPSRVSTSACPRRRSA